MAYSKPTNRDYFTQIAEQMKKYHLARRRLEVNVKKAKKVHLDEKWTTYPMTTSPKGVAVIINNENFPRKQYKRYGSRVDVENLKDLCEQLDFYVEIYQDLSAEATVTTLNDVVNHPLLKTTDMLWVTIMSHGEEGYIYCSDGCFLQTEQILSTFACPWLVRTPKFIMFQATIGHTIDNGLARMQMTDSNPGNKKDLTWNNMLIANSPLPMRDSLHGSWFIEALVRVFMNEACEMDLFSMLFIVTDVINEDHYEKGYKQSIEITVRGGFKSLFF